MMRPAAGDYYAGQHCRSDDSGDRPHPPRWWTPATGLDHIA